MSWLLPRLIGVARSNDLLLTGRVVDAAEALTMGLVSRVLPDDELLDACLDVAESMARFSPYGLAMTKDVLWANLEVASLEAAVELEDRNQLMLGFTENLPEAIRAFDAGRAPVHRRAPHGDVPRVALGRQRPAHSRTRKAPRPAGSRSASASVTRLRARTAARSPIAARSSPDRAGPRRRARRSRGAAKPVGLGRDRGAAAASWSTATSQVMSWVAEAVERRPAARVAAGRCAPTPTTAERPARRWSTA